MVGDYVITAEYNGSSVTGALAIAHGNMVSLALSGSTGATADDTVTYSVTASDANGNTWDVTDSSTFDADGAGVFNTNVLSANTVGSYTGVSATYGGETATAALVVYHGIATSVDLSGHASMNATIDASTAATGAYVLVASDTDGNTWDVTASGSFVVNDANAGSFANNVFTADTAGNYTVTAQYTNALSSVESDSLALTINPGATVASVSITPSSATIAQTQSYQYEITAYDANGNVNETNITDGGTWSLFVDSTDGESSSIVSGLLTAGSTTNTGGVVVTLSGSYAGYNATATGIVTAGALDHIFIQDTDAVSTQLTAQSINTDDTITLYSVGYSDTGSTTKYGDVAVDWIVTPSDLGSFIISEGSSTVFVPAKVGTGTVTLVDSDASTNAESGAMLDITVTAGLLSPTDLTLVASGTGSLDLTWTDNSGTETEYIWNNVTTGQTGSLLADATTHTISGLDSNTQYSVRVASYSVEQGYKYSAFASKYTEASAPHTLTSSVVSGNIQLSWDANNNPNDTRYGVYRDQDGSGMVAVQDFTNNLTFTSYTDTDINPASAYDYYVVAYNGDSLETGTSNTVSEVLNVYPDLVSNISFVNEDAIMDGYVATGSFTSEFALSDTNNGDQLQYRIQIADTTDFGNILVDYTSGYQTQGTGSFTVGQSAGSGTYNMVSPTTLIDGTYYARVQLSDNFAQSLSTPENITTANVFAVIVDTTSPNAINAGNITLNKNSNILSVTDTISMDDQALQSTTYATVYSGSSVDNNVISGPTLVDINGVIPDVGLGDNQYENVCIVQQDNAGNTTEEVCKTNDITAPSGSVSVTTSDEDHLLGIGDTFDVSFVSNPSENNLSVHTQPEFAGTGHVLVSIGGGVYSASHTVQESVLYTDNDTLTGVSMKDIYGNLSAVYSTGTDITFDTVRPVISSVSFDQAGNTVGVGDQVIVTVTATDDTGYDFPSTISVNGSLATRSGAATVNPATYVYTIAEGNTDVTEVQASSVSLDDTAGNTTNSVTSYTSAIVVDANTPTVSMTFSGANTLVAGVGTGTITPDVTVSQSFGSGDSIAYAWSYTGGNLTGTSSDAILEVDLSSYISSAVETINYSLVATVTDAVNTVTEVFTGLLTVNNYPVITSATGFVATEDTLFSTGFSATDADDETLVYAFTSATLTSAVMSGSVLSVTPDNSLVGTQTGMLSVTDEKGGVTSQEISLVVANVNDAPVIETDNSPVNAQQGADISFVVEMSDDDMIHGDTLAFVLTGATADDSDTTIGTAVLTGTTATSAIVSWIPQEEDIYTGLIFDTQQENKFTIEVTDNSGSVVTKEFTVLVQGTNDIPVINSVVVDAIHADTLAVSVDAYDPDLGGTASIDLAEYTLMSGATVVANGSLAGTGTYTFDTSAIAYQTGLVVEAQVFDAIGSGSLVATSSAIVVDNTDPTSGTVTLSGSSAANSFVITAVEGTDNHAYSGSILVYGQSGSTLTHTSALVFGNTISGLLANTWYEVKQYDYDTAGNSSSTSAFIKTNALPVASNISIFGSGATATGGVITTNDDVYFSYNYSDIDAQTESGTVYSLVLNGDVIAGPVPSITASDVVQLAYSGELAAGDTIKVQVTPKDSVDAGVVYASKSYLVYPYTTEESEEVILEVDVATGSVVELPEETETGTTIVTSDDVQVPNTGSTVGTLTTNIELVYEEGDDSIPEAQTVLTVETEVFEVVAQDASGSDILSIYTGVILAPTPVEATATQVAVADTVLDKDIKVVYSVGAEDKSLVFSGSEVEMTFEIPAGTTNSSIYYFDEDTQQWSQEGITIVSTTSTTITFTTNHMTDYSVMSDKVVSVVTTSSSSGGGGGGWSSYIYSLFTETGEESSTDESAIDDIVAQEEIESVVEESVAPQTAGGTDSVEVVETTIVNEEKIVAQLEEDELAEISALAQALQTASVPVEYYTVQSGDTLSSIAYQYDVSWKQIADYNGLEDPSLIFQGNQLAFSADMVANKKEMEVSRDAMTELQQEEDKAIELARIEQDMKEEQERKEQERQLALEKAKVEAEKLEQELAQREQEVEMTKEALESNQEVSMETVVEAMDTEEQEGFVTRLWTHIKNFFASLFGF
ncbi:MAG: LysM peptidoglycan-binding domain-containing protein [Patescibacteria group bacterium]|nr:LysM peptidoglycan-binding domain-containing protein [Patescibacteria group bacterium]